MSTPVEQLTTMQPGLYHGISNEDYHAGTGVSSSGIKLLRRSPLHYWERYLNPAHEVESPSPEMRLGTLVHTLVLEPAAVGERYAVEPLGINKRTVAGKVAFETFHQMNQGKDIVTPELYGKATRIATAVTSHPKAARVFENGQAEQSLFWTDPDTGVLCKCRPDWWRDILVADLKTAIDASEDGFQRAIFYFGYHISAALYLDGIKQHTGVELPFIFTAVEKEPPYAVANYHIHDEAIALGRKQYKQGLERYARCMEQGLDRKHWTGYPLGLQTIDLPGWVYRKM